MYISISSRNGHRFDCVMAEPDCSLRAADHVDGGIVNLDRPTFLPEGVPT